MEARFRAVMTHIRQAHLLAAPDLEYMDGGVATLVRLRDSFLPELAVLLVLVIHTALTYKGLVDPTPWLARGGGDNLQLSVAGWYAVLVSAPIFQFLLGLSLWKWLLWVIFALKLSQRNLKLIPTHPDKHGGARFPQRHPASLRADHFCGLGGNWSNLALRHPSSWCPAEGFHATALVVIVAFVALGPLVFFVPRLAALRRRGILEYGILGQLHSTEFHQK